MSERARRLVLDAQGQVHIESMPVPEPAADQVLVRIHTTQVSAGSEMNAVRRRRQAHTAEAQTPLPEAGMGYTAVGVIEAVGDAVDGWAVGERVLCSGNHGSHWLVTPSAANDFASVPQQYALQRVPEALDDTQVCFGVLGDIALHGIRRAQIQLGESVAVHGLGVIGNLCVQLARRSGAYPVIGLDLDPERMALAEQLGATDLVNVGEQEPVGTIRELTRSEWRYRGALPGLEPDGGAHVQFHCTSVIDNYPVLLKSAADRGRIVLVGAAGGQVAIETHELFRRELKVMGSYETGVNEPHPYWPWSRARNRQVIWDMIARGELDVAPLVSHVAPAAEAPALYDKMHGSTQGWMSVFFTWQDE
jgi:threonine dehydrogenase-like Zn-dependent dehydrogenase